MEGILTKGQQVATAVVRVAVGTIFLTAGLEKALGAEPFSAAGFLKFGTTGTPLFGTAAENVVYNPFHDFWMGLAGNATLLPIINWLVVFGEIAIGAALILGLFTRFAAIAGALMMGLFYIASWDFAHRLVHQQFLYWILAAFVAYAKAGEAYGFDAIIDKTETVKAPPSLRFVLG